MTVESDRSFNPPVDWTNNIGHMRLFSIDGATHLSSDVSGSKRNDHTGLDDTSLDTTCRRESMAKYEYVAL